MNNTKETQVHLLQIQLIAGFGFLLTVMISILLTYDKLLSLQNKERLFTNEQVKTLSYFNSILIIFVVILYLLVGYGNILIAKKEHKKTRNLYLQEFNSTLAFLAALSGFYIVTHEENQEEFHIVDTEIL